uniref:NTF2-related export protein n=1 Tax=Meloidogyne enterolobii TaxID=390850 RepID=A0A6V7TNQ4_MELEN|nr:unnamed protein product [Meloidogyne enterolobii]
MAYNTNFDQVGQAFIAHYYSKFDVPDVAARTAGLTDLYDADLSFMTFEGTPVRGRAAILEKFGSLQFRSIQHAITMTDCQPLPDGSILVTVIGQLKCTCGLSQTISADIFYGLIMIFTKKTHNGQRSRHRIYYIEKGQL